MALPYTFSLILAGSRIEPNSIKMMLWKCYIQYASKFGKLSSGHRPGKGPFSFQWNEMKGNAFLSSQWKAMPKNVQTTAQLHSSHTLVNNAQNSPIQVSWFMNCELPAVQAGIRKDRARKFQKKHLFLLYWLCQSPWLCGSQYTVENSERDGHTRPLDPPLEKSICRSGSKS